MGRERIFSLFGLKQPLAICCLVWAGSTGDRKPVFESTSCLWTHEIKYIYSIPHALTVYFPIDIVYLIFYATHVYRELTKNLNRPFQITHPCAILQLFTLLQLINYPTILHSSYVLYINQLISPILEVMILTSFSGVPNCEVTTVFCHEIATSSRFKYGSLFELLQTFHFKPLPLGYNTHTYIHIY